MTAVLRVAILGIEPIEPAVGGSRQRLEGLYHALEPNIDAVYVGAYHWRGPAFRRFRHSPGLEEITVPFSAAHFDAIEALSAEVRGAGVIDASFPRFGHLSESLCRHAREAAARADVVVFSHPWMFAVMRDGLDRGRQMVVYDAHNLEGTLRRRLLGGSPAGDFLADDAERLERDLCGTADLVLTCSHAERTAFAELYGLPQEKLRVAPNGVFAGRITPADPAARLHARRQLGLGSAPVALFVGASYPPNLEAATFVRERLAPSCPRIVFAILGGAGDGLGSGKDPRNLRRLGTVDEETKRRWLAAADVGINPMFAGAGTNIKVLEYMAAGLPVVTTPFGARGIDESGAVCVIASADDFAGRLAALVKDRDARLRHARGGGARIERDFDWANISPEAGVVLASRARAKNERPPYFSVIVPTIDRPKTLRRLFDLLAAQSERDFEVVAVDQSPVPFEGTLEDFGLTGVLFRTPIPGAGRARNLAANIARGQVLAFIDDDCEPSVEWLAAARARLEDPALVGLEGRVFSDKLADPAWRSVHNYGSEGVGFVTGNLFVRAEAFHRLGGFDTMFDELQFREDTDLGWRLQKLGEVPFSEAATVYHPPWSRKIPRESDAARALLFESDALMLHKHLERFRETFVREGHWLKGEAFWEPFLRGVRKHGVALPDDLLAMRHSRRQSAGAEMMRQLAKPNGTRRRALMAKALVPGEARLALRMSLQRARRHADIAWPCAIDFRSGGNAGEFVVGDDWGAADQVGSWTVGPVAQLLVVPDAPSTGPAVIEFEIESVFLAPRHPRQSVTVDVNGETSAPWRFAEGEPHAKHRSVAVSAAAVERLGAFLVTITMGGLRSPYAAGVSHDTRDCGIRLKELRIRLGQGPLPAGTGAATLPAQSLVNRGQSL